MSDEQRTLALQAVAQMTAEHVRLSTALADRMTAYTAHIRTTMEARQPRRKRAQAIGDERTRRAESGVRIGASAAGSLEARTIDLYSEIMDGTQADLERANHELQYIANTASAALDAFKLAITAVAALVPDPAAEPERASVSYPGRRY